MTPFYETRFPALFLLILSYCPSRISPKPKHLIIMPNFELFIIKTPWETLWVTLATYCVQPLDQIGTKQPLKYLNEWMNFNTKDMVALVSLCEGSM